MNCPRCGHELGTRTAAQILRAKKTPARVRASRENGRKGGRPKKQPKQTSPKPDA